MVRHVGPVAIFGKPPDAQAPGEQDLQHLGDLERYSTSQTGQSSPFGASNYEDNAINIYDDAEILSRGTPEDVHFSDAQDSVVPSDAPLAGASHDSDATIDTLWQDDQKQWEDWNGVELDRAIHQLFGTTLRQSARLFCDVCPLLIPVLNGC